MIVSRFWTCPGPERVKDQALNVEMSRSRTCSDRERSERPGRECV